MTDESLLRTRLRAAIGEADLPSTLGADARHTLEQFLRTPRSGHKWAFTAVAGLLCVAVIAGLFTADVLGRKETAPALIIAPPANCAAAALVVTGIKGERVHPTVLPTGFVLKSGNEGDLGGISFLDYSRPGGGDPYIQLTRYFTNRPPADEMLPPVHVVTVPGIPGSFAVDGQQPDPDLIAVGWSPSPGIVLVMAAIGLQISESGLIAIAEAVSYTPGVEFTYPTTLRVDVSRARAVSISGMGSDAHVVLSSYGEVDAVLHPHEAINHLPALPIDVIRPVWVVWQTTGSASNINARIGAVVDATTGTTLIHLAPADTAAVSSLSDRSSGACLPPFGVLTRNEVEFLLPARPGTQRSVKLMQFQALGAVPSDGFSIGGCLILTCDPTVPVWAIATTASDPRFIDFSPCGLWSPTVGKCWYLGVVDARTGPQHTEFGGSGGPGPLPPAVASLPDLDPSPIT